MTVGSGVEALPKEVAYMAQANEEKIAQIRGKENVVRRVLMKFFDLGPRFVCRPISIIFVRAKTKLQMVGGNELFRGRRDDGVCQTVRIVIWVVVDYGVLR